MSKLSDMTGEEFERFINSGGDIKTLEPETPETTLEEQPTVVEEVPVPEQPVNVIEESTYNPADETEDKEPEGGYKVLIDFPNPALFLAFFDKSIADGEVKMHPWQLEVNSDLAPQEKPTSTKPLKYYLVAANGSGKDAFVIAPFAAWFIFCKIKARCIITSSSGGQLSSQTETYIKSMCEKVNQFFGTQVFRIRQRYIRCLATGSEIRMFATDEAGKAEGYHPIEPNAEMAIIKNESKSIAEDIHRALKRCTGYNYWLEVSSPGLPQGAFYYAATKWPHGRKITSYDCPHISEEERESDKIELGEHSAEYRSKHLAEFTSSAVDVVVPSELVNKLNLNPPLQRATGLGKRVGIDLAAGGDETTICITDSGYTLKEKWFKEKDTTVEAEIIATFLKDNGIPKDHPYIYADDGGIGHAIIDMLIRDEWKINRVRNDAAALNKKRFGNRGAELWFNVKRVFEEGIIDVRPLSNKTLEQLGSRRYRQVAGGRIFLQSKREAKSQGFNSPDRADAYVLSFCGLTILDFVDATVSVERVQKVKLLTPDAVAEYYETNLYSGETPHEQKPPAKPVRGSLQTIINRLIK